MNSGKNRQFLSGRYQVAFWLALTFTGSALLASGVLRVSGAASIEDGASTQRFAVQAEHDAEQTVPRLPAGSEEKLAKARFPQPVMAADINNPFVDRTNTSGMKAGGVVAGLPGGAGTRGRLRREAPSDAGQAVSVPPVPDLNTRLSAWRREAARAYKEGRTPPPVTAAYLVSELSPTGTLNTRGGHRAVWFYIEAEKRSISADVNTPFYDAILRDVTDEGPVFRMTDGSTRTISWAGAPKASSPAPVPLKQSAPPPSGRKRNRLRTMIDRKGVVTRRPRRSGVFLNEAVALDRRDCQAGRASIN